MATHDSNQENGHKAIRRGARSRNDPLRRRLRRRHAARRPAVHQHLRRLRQRHQHLPRTSRPRSARPQGSLPGVSAFQVSFSSYDIYTPGDQPDVLVAMNPAALKAHLADLPQGRHADRQQGRVQRDRTSRRPPTRPTRSKTAASARYRVFEVPIGTLNARALAGQRPQHQADRPLEEHVRARPHVLDVQPPPGHRRSTGSNDKFGKNPKVARRQHRDAQGRLQLRRDHGDVRRALPRAEGAAGARPLPQHHRQRSDGARLPRRLQARGPPALLRQLPDHAGQRHPARAGAFKHFGVKTFQAEDEIAAIGSAIGAVLRRLAGPHRHQRPRHRAQERGARPRRDGRAAARRHRRAALRPQHRHADQDRAGGPAAVHVRPQRRVPGRDRRAGDPVRLLRHGDRGLPHRRSST